MKGYRFDRAYLAGSPSPSPVELARGVSHVLRRAGSYDLLHVHGEVAAGLCLPRLWFGRSIVTLHGLHLVRRLHGARLRLAVLNLRAMVRVADRTICVSQTEYDELARLAGAAATRRAVVIRNGVRIPPAPTEQERASIRKELGLAAEELVAIWVGSLDERSDPLTAVRAAEAAGVTLLVVGDGRCAGLSSALPARPCAFSADETTCPAYWRPQTSTSRRRTARASACPSSKRWPPGSLRS